MKSICSVCNRTSIDRNILCLEINCPVNKNLILGNGQIVGGVKIVDLQQITKAYAIYRGVRDKTNVLLKVAHRESGPKNQLKLESRFLSGIAKTRLSHNEGRFSFLFNPIDAFQGIPNLLPAYPNANIEQFPYGEAVIDGSNIVFAVWDMIEGIPLKQYLTAQPEPWIDNVAFVINRLAYILNLMHNSNGMMHGKLTPDAVWVEEDNQGILRATLVDFGLLQSDRQLDYANIIWLHEYMDVAYIAPEILAANNHDITNYTSPNTHAIDIYGLGLVMYEMLAGRPKHVQGVRSRALIVKDIKRYIDKTLKREDLENTNRKNLVILANQASSEQVTYRKPNQIPEFIQNIERIVGPIPVEKQPSSIRRRVWRIALFVSLIVGGYLLLSVLFASLGA